ncbi:transketolase family protein [Phosphitispora fastidiosa]|uniref:transketolase family protein n=1 Tax=Phosphitispora fastidiosa TaxID=2837202 RepID=UPI001E4A8165|nr:transketolase [Phosphitispora fastidiosa]
MSKKIATREAYGKTLARLGAVNNNIVVLDADLSKSTKTADFAAVFPERFFDMGVAEQNMLGTAAGLAAAGKIPFASSFAVFATGRAFEQIRNSIAYPKLNVKIAATHAGISVGEDGASHQSIEDISLMRTLPNMTVIVPADAVETEKAVEAAVEIKGPVYLRLGRLGLPAVFDENYRFEVGKAVTLREGSDVTVIACGLMVGQAVEAAEALAGENISVRVINMHTIKPIDRDVILKAARETGAVVTAEEHNIIGGLGSAVAEVLVQSEPVPQEMVGVRDTFGESGPPSELLQKYGLMAGDIAAAAKKVMGRKKG